MNTLILKDMDKSLGIASFKNGDLNLGIKYFETYLAYLQDCIDSNSNNENFTLEKNKTIDLYKNILFEQAKKMYSERKWLSCAMCCQLLIQYNTKDYEVYKNAAFCFVKLQEAQTAIKLLEIYKKKVPDDPQLPVCLAEAYLASNPHQYADIALDLYKTYLETHPNDANIYNEIGHIYASIIDAESEDVERQLYYFNKALSFSPNNFAIMRNIHLSYMQKGDLPAATAQYEKIYELFKDKFTSDDFFDYATYQIHIGNFKKGWALLDHRFLKKDSVIFYPKINRPLWDGIKNISKKTLLVYPEQGLGDVIMYIRFVEYMKTFAQNVIALVPNELFHLFKDSNLGFPIYPVSVELSNLNFDYHIPLMSVPRIYQISPNNIPKKEGYLSVDSVRQKSFRESFVNSSKFKVGVCFEGAVGTHIKHRNIPWEKIKILANNPNIQLYCFKKELTEEFFKEIDSDLDIVCLGKYFNTFADTAAAIKNMDLMISTDNVILNLSGALGVKTFGLFNKNREYRWYGLEDGKMIWYDSVIPYMPTKLNNWDSVLEKIAQNITDLCSNQYAQPQINIVEETYHRDYSNYYSAEDLFGSNNDKWV